uniref:DUF1618 domain-containing protein n=1 Tax=Leersia perrieri TaxID=77586 RepID=A0A0D9W812_9ORYZ
MESSPTLQPDTAAAATAAVEEEVGDGHPLQEWVMLSAVPVVRRSSSMFPPGTDFVLALQKPPRVSAVTISGRIAPGQATLTLLPYIVDVDAGGAFLLHVTQRPREPPLATGADASVRVRHRELGRAPMYFICDAQTGAASRVPDSPAGRPPIEVDRVGFISTPSGGGGAASYIITELVPLQNTDQTILRRYWTDTGVWLDRKVTYASPGHPGSWVNHAVISHAQKIWWVDLSCGLLACDPSPITRIFPSFQFRTGVCSLHPARQRTTAGSLRYVQIHARLGEKMISIWKLTDPEHAMWEPEFDLRLTDIWTRSWVRKLNRKKGLGLMVAAAHPVLSDILFFIHKNIMFTVDVRARKLITCSHVDMTEYQSSRYVHAWLLNRPLRQEHDESPSPSAVTVGTPVYQSEPIQLKYQQVPRAKEDQFERLPEDTQKEERKKPNGKRHGLAMKARMVNRV